jgi:hypothetical protein
VTGALRVIEADFYRPASRVRDPAKLKPYYQSGYGAGLGVVKTCSELARRFECDQLKVVDHQVFAYLRHRARDLTYPLHTVPIADVTRYVGCTRTELLESLSRIRRARIQIAGRDEATGLAVQMVCGYCSHVARAYEIEYGFDPVLVKFMDNPAVFSLLHLDELRRFRSAAGFRLYELMSLEFAKKNPTAEPRRLNQEQLHRLFGEFAGVRTVKLENGLEVAEMPKWHEFYRSKLRRAVEEFNQISLDWLVHAEVRHAGRGDKVVEVVFSLHRKRASLSEKAVGADGERRTLMDLYKDGQIPSQETLKIEQAIEKRELTPYRHRRRPKLANQWDPSKVASWCKVTDQEIPNDKLKWARELVAQSSYQELHDDRSVDADTYVRYHLIPQFSQMLSKSFQAGAEPDIEREFTKFVTAKVAYINSVSKSVKTRWRRELTMPTLRHLDHWAPEPGEEGYLEPEIEASAIELEDGSVAQLEAQRIADGRFIDEFERIVYGGGE